MKLLLVDGYNLMHASKKLSKLAETDLEAARDELVRMLLDYSGREDVRVEVVFDAGGRPGPETKEKTGDLVTVTYTARGKTADARLEKAAYEAGREEATLVTGDYQQQKVGTGAGALIISSREFIIELEAMPKSGRGGKPQPARKRSRLEDRLPDEVREKLREMRERGP